MTQLLPRDGTLNQNVQQNDLLLYVVDSLDLWVKIRFNCSESLNVMTADLDIKIDKKMLSKNFERLL
jgi:hypothetical protein